MRFQIGPYIFKCAETAAEFEQIHALNYRTFIRELGQYEDTGEGRLVDKFHSKNLYFIALRDERVVGMVSVHDQPPFSVASRLVDPGILQAPDIRPLEVRLLAIEPAERQSAVFGRLIWAVYQHAENGNYTHLFVSGLEGRLKLYSRLGFKSLGPPVCSGRTRFIPMSMPMAQLGKRHARLVRRLSGYTKKSVR